MITPDELEIEMKFQIADLISIEIMAMDKDTLIKHIQSVDMEDGLYESNTGRSVSFKDIGLKGIPEEQLQSLLFEIRGCLRVKGY